MPGVLRGGNRTTADAGIILYRAGRVSKAETGFRTSWLPGMDSNHDQDKDIRICKLLI
jgi:hypothetical protein